ncbi:MAG TPA: vWA domain-containing protein, partial [Miltoncostaea sp.]|nr:vWA domain-containing protein [Miltoncostaea sp.]
VALLSAALGAACAAGSGRPGGPDSSGGPGGSGTAGGGQGGDLGFGSSSVSGGDGGSGGGIDACAAAPYQAQRLPLDMYIMLDKSGSMHENVSGGGNKWQAVTAAIQSFVSQPGLGDISVGMQFFPLFVTAAECSVACSSDADCGPFAPCDQASPSTPGTCQNCYPGADSCVVRDYSTPAVEIAPLPGVVDPLVSAMQAQSPLGATPTSAALQGALDHGKDWAQAHPGHVTIAVLATDGEPTDCDTNLMNIDAIAAAAAGGSPKVLTFAIGVFTPYDIMYGSPAKLDAIAAAGGTGKATVIDTTQNVNQEFLAALDKIRDAALACSYDIPTPEAGTPDFSRLNVQYTPGGGGAPVVFDHYTDKSQCPASGGGWYYDDPAHPTQIILCDAACAEVSADKSGKMDILLGCKTKEPA